MMDSRKPRAISFFRMAQALLLQGSRGARTANADESCRQFPTAISGLAETFVARSGPTVFASQTRIEEATTMIENHYYADVNLPNHVWIREWQGGKSRWVLRDASELKRAAHTGRGGAAPGAAKGAGKAGPAVKVGRGS